MNLKKLYQSINVLNESELFYKRYYDAQNDPEDLKRFLSELDPEFVKSNNLLIPELKETIPPTYLEEWFFDLSSKNSIHIHKHNCFSPNITHKHDFFEFFYVLEGSCEQSISHATSTMVSGDICLVPPGIEHSISVYDESKIVNILIRRSTFEDIFLNFLRSDNIISRFFMNNLYAPHANDYIIFKTGDDKEIEHLIMNLFLEYYNKDVYYNELLNSNLVSLFAKILRNHEDSCILPTPVNNNRDLAYDLVRYIKDNYKDVTLEEVSKHFHFTQEYTSRLIRKLTNSSFTKILRSTRLDIAISLLTDTNLSVRDVSYNVGYPNPEHFIRVFKKEYNITPSEYRKIYS